MLFTMTSEIIKSNPDNPHLQIAALCPVEGDLEFCFHLKINQLKLKSRQEKSGSTFITRAVKSKH